MEKKPVYVKNMLDFAIENQIRADELMNGQERLRKETYQNAEATPSIKDKAINKNVWYDAPMMKNFVWPLIVAIITIAIGLVIAH